jgi:methylated-DNA-[protein]-cysteine S-methyltransferase
MNTRIKSIIKNLPSTFYYDILTSPVGNLCLVVTDIGVHALLWECDIVPEVTKLLKQNKLNKKHEYITKAKKQLKEYFRGERTKFDLPIIVEGTSFQKNTWNSLQKIPFGKTLSYGQQAELLGDKNKVRAVGTANGRNPLSIIIPCHRVVGKSGKLVGYAGGLSIKEKLINLENNFIAAS